MTTVNLMRDRGSVGVEPWTDGGESAETGGVRSVQVGVIGVGAVSATIRISGCNDGRFPMTVVDFTISGTNMATEAAELTFPWQSFRAEIIAITGVNASASAVLKT